MGAFPIYILRHGLAGQFGDYADDRARPLTEAGRQRTTAVAKRLVAIGCNCDVILTSPYQRAAQTAQILHCQFPQADYETLTALQPGGDYLPVNDRLQQIDRTQSVWLIGHEPNLTQIAERLIWGEVRSQLVLKKTGTIRLDAPMQGPTLGQCKLRWLFPAKVLLGH